MPFKALNNKEKEKAEHSYIYSHTHTHTTKHLTLLTKSKRSQSALEYMMTYGWAILIIVIVAVILYSMGIFNPSSSITTTSVGFSPFVVSSAICNSGGLSFSINAGALPNLATSVTLNKVYITSSSGTNSLNNQVYPLNPIILTSGKSTVLRLPIVCSSGSKFSLSSKIEYSYSTAAGGVVTNATGTISGTASSNINEIAEFSDGGVNANDPTPNNWTDGYTFSIWVEYPGRSFCGYALGLVDYQTSSYVPRGGTVLMCSSSNDPYAETLISSGDQISGISSTLNNFTWYLLTGVYNPNKDNISLYINGTLVVSVPDSVTPSSFTPTGNLYEYTMGGVAGFGNAPVFILKLKPPELHTAGGYAGVADTWGWGYGVIYSGYSNIGNPFDLSSGSGVASIYWIANGDEGVGWNYDFSSSTNTNEVFSSSLYIAIGIGNSAPGSNINYYWLRTRTYPPNGVMPSVTFGSVV